MFNRGKNNDPIHPFPYDVYFWTVVVLAAAGLADSIYLSISHYRVYTDIAYESLCAISRSINCDTVSQSPYSIILGVPVPVWGVIGYTLFLILLSFARTAAANRKRMWSFLFCIALLYSIYSLILAAISSFIIHSYCIMCIVSYGINFLLLYYTWLIRRRFDRTGFWRSLREDFRFIVQYRQRFLAALTPFAGAVIILWVVFPVYWYFTPPVLSSEVPTGVTADGHPRIGSENAELEITEFADYMCFQCNKMHYYLRKLMARYPGKIKIIHRHFPMDHRVNPLVKRPVHQGSGILALFAIYAATQGKFWQMNDLLFSVAREMEQIDTRFLAESAGLDARELSRSLNDPQIWQNLRDDMTAGFKIGVTGTPTFVIDGEVYHGMIPLEILTKIID
jgi:protein-disulfide isomerase/uncharacterized membrane protein